LGLPFEGGGQQFLHRPPLLPRGRGQDVQGQGAGAPALLGFGPLAQNILRAARLY